jgi:hypothetical protein
LFVLAMSGAVRALSDVLVVSSGDIIRYGFIPDLFARR